MTITDTQPRHPSASGPATRRAPVREPDVLPTIPVEPTSAPDLPAPAAVTETAATAAASVTLAPATLPAVAVTLDAWWAVVESLSAATAAATALFVDQLTRLGRAWSPSEATPARS